jgi:hypothetical protein
MAVRLSMFWLFIGESVINRVGVNVQSGFIARQDSPVKLI